MGDPILIESYDPAWPTRFASLGARMRGELGERALRIDPVGSTSVTGLAAKPVIDIQISVRVLEPVAPYADRLARLGFQWRADNSDHLGVVAACRCLGASDGLGARAI